MATQNWNLTKAEAKALAAVCEHGSTKGAARALGLSQKTVEGQVHSSTKKGGFSTRLQCLLAWSRDGRKTRSESVTVVGIKADGSSTVLGTTGLTPAMQRREIARDMCGELSDEEHGTAGDFCLWALEQYHEWLESQGWQPPPLVVTPAIPRPAQ